MDDLTERLRRFIRRRVSSRQDAEDVIQDAYLRVLRYAGDHEVADRERLLFSAAKNLAVDNERRQRVRHRIAADSAVFAVSADDLPAADEVFDARQRLQRVETAISALPPRCREVFLMHRIDGMSYSQIAEICGISVSAVEKNIARACLLIESRIEGESHHR